MDLIGSWAVDCEAVQVKLARGCEGVGESPVCYQWFFAKQRNYPCHSRANAASSIFKLPVTPLFAKDRIAAALLDLKLAEFLRLVDSGVLPRPTSIGGFERWDVEQLQAIARGDAIQGGAIVW